MPTLTLSVSGVDFCLHPDDHHHHHHGNRGGGRRGRTGDTSSSSGSVSFIPCIGGTKDDDDQEEQRYQLKLVNFTGTLLVVPSSRKTSILERTNESATVDSDRCEATSDATTPKTNHHQPCRFSKPKSSSPDDDSAGQSKRRRDVDDDLCTGGCRDEDDATASSEMTDRDVSITLHGDEAGSPSSHLPPKKKTRSSVPASPKKPNKEAKRASSSSASTTTEHEQTSQTTRREEREDWGKNSKDDKDDLEEEEDREGSVTTLRPGRLDCSQTQQSCSIDDAPTTTTTQDTVRSATQETVPVTEQDLRSEPNQQQLSRVEEIMDANSTPGTCTQTQTQGCSYPDDDDNDAVSVHPRSNLILEEDPDEENTEALAVNPPPARVSLGTSPVLDRGCLKEGHQKRTEPPSARWGHTMTRLGDKDSRFLVYGGQTLRDGDDNDGSSPETLSDVYLYDANKGTWCTPRNCHGMPLQWHTSTYLPDRQLLISFGGETTVGEKADGKKKQRRQKKTKTTDQVRVLDTEIMLWYPPTVTGNVPAARSGHTATLLSDGSDRIVYFGGCSNSKWLNSVSILDAGQWQWTAPKVLGTAPKPRSYHTASAVAGNRVVIFGGNNRCQSFNSVHVLHVPENVIEAAGSVIGDEDENDDDDCSGEWRWTHPTVSGEAPAPRTGACAVVLGDNKTVCIYGGWDPNAEDESDVKKNDEDEEDEAIIYRDCFLLDTEKWSWKRAMCTRIEAEPGDGGGDSDIVGKCVGHAAALLKGCGDGDGATDSHTSELIVFGGRIPGDIFTNDLQTLRVLSRPRDEKD